MPPSPPHLLPILSLLFLLFSTSLPLSHSTPLSPPTNVTLSGDAHFANTTISLTPQLNCRSPPSSSPDSLGYGRAFFFAPVRFLDPQTNRTASFSTQFSFAITNPYAPLCPFGEGFTFLITSKTDSFSYGSMGVPNGQDFAYVAVEFDTMLDPNVGDVNDNHVGIDVDSVVSVASVDGFSKGIDLKSGRPLTAWIEYRSGEDMIKVWVGYSQVKPPSPLLVAQIDLSKHLKEFMHVGFSASNGRGSAIHLVGQWKFKTYGLFPSVMPMETVNAGEGDCFMCSSPGELGGQNSNNANYHHINKRIRELALGIGGLAALIISLSAILVIVICCMIRKRRLNSRGSNEGNKLPKRLSLSAIRSATKGFNHNRIIGEGGSATVYKGSLPSCGPVAVKRFSQVSQLGIFRNQFATEFTTMMGCLKHKHLVQLQGWCCEDDELVLVYQYMPNGSLDKILHRNNNALTALSLLLTWDRRVNIVLGVASALIYLHEEFDRQIIHRDVKTCNIMLDDELNAKLGDFGLAEIYEHSCRTRDSTIPAGTMGYLAPEYVYLGVPTVKTDVYSFGVVVLEVASGKRPVSEEGTLLADYMWEVWGKGKLMEAADCRLRGKYNKLEMERVLMVGLCCVHPDYEKRPTVREAATMIRGEAPLPVLPVRKPSVSIGRSGFPGAFDEFMSFCGREDFDFGDTTPWLTPESHF